MSILNLKNLTKTFKRVKLCNHRGGENMSLTKQSKNSYRFECMINRQRFSYTFKINGQSMREIRRAFQLWKISCNDGLYVNNVHTFAHFADIWLNEYCRDYSPLVIKNYRCNLKNWILPALGKYKLNDITPLVLDGFLNHLKSTNNLANGQAKLSNNTVSKLWAITRAIISTAYVKNLIPTNPCTKVKLEFKKELGKKQLHAWDLDMYKYALRLLENDTSDNARVCEFAVKTGLRRSEIWGLTWNDVDFDSKTISINKTLQKVNGVMQVLPCKTQSSVRVITIPDTLINMLRLYRFEHTSNKFIFENVDYDACPAWFRKWQVKNHIPKIRFHDLRHTHASLLLAKSIDIKTISERLGHSNIGITMNTYTHVMRELDEKASKAIDEIA